MSRPNDLMVRWITRWDREAVTRLLGALAGEHGFSPAQETLERAFEHALRAPQEVRFCVAVRDGQVIGQASLQRSFSTWNASPCGTVEDVFVVEHERRNGIATAILEFLATEARRRGYCRLRLDVKQDNVPARTLYERLGFEEVGYAVYELSLVQHAEDDGKPSGV